MKQSFKSSNESEGEIGSHITLYSGPEDHYSHRTRFALRLKKVHFSLKNVLDLKRLPEELKEINPYHQLRAVPTLVDRDMVLYEPNVILQYIDDRFPSQLLIPTQAREKARFCMELWRIRVNLIDLADSILKEKNKYKAAEMSRELRTRLVDFSTQHLVNDLYHSEPRQLTMLDCILAPVLLRLPSMGIRLRSNVAKYQPLRRYMQMIFTEKAFSASCSEEELSLLNSFG